MGHIAQFRVLNPQYLKSVDIIFRISILCYVYTICLKLLSSHYGEMVC